MNAEPIPGMQELRLVEESTCTNCGRALIRTIESPPGCTIDGPWYHTMRREQECDPLDLKVRERQARHA